MSINFSGSPPIDTRIEQVASSFISIPYTSFAGAAANGGSYSINSGTAYGWADMNSGTSLNGNATLQITHFINVSPGTGVQMNWGVPFMMTFMSSALIGGTNTSVDFRIGIQNGGGWPVNTQAYTVANTEKGVGFKVIGGVFTPFYANGTSVTYGSGVSVSDYFLNIWRWRVINNGSTVKFFLNKNNTGWTEVGSVPIPITGGATAKVSLSVINNGSSGENINAAIYGSFNIYNYNWL